MKKVTRYKKLVTISRPEALFKSMLHETQSELKPVWKSFRLHGSFTAAHLKISNRF